jgi:hypothetical protein
MFPFPFPREVHEFSGEVQKISGEVQNDLRRGTHIPHVPSKWAITFNTQTHIPLSRISISKGVIQ